MRNTSIQYEYCDADGYKNWQYVVAPGMMSEEEKEQIIHSLESGEFFIPEQVGLPCERFGAESDHAYCILRREWIMETNDYPTISLSASGLSSAFKATKGIWESWKYCY